MIRRTLAVAAVLVMLSACAGDTAAPEGGPAPDEAPSELAVGGSQIRLSTYAWQDQMPTVGDEPGPCASLCVSGTVEVAGGGPLPDDLEVLDIVALVDGEEHAFEEVELTGLLGPSNYEFVVRRGPALVPGTTFDLAVQLEVGGEVSWIRAPRVVVERTV